MNMKSDILNIRILFGIGKVLGVTPLWMNHSNLKWKIYICSLFPLVMIGTFLSIKKRYVALSELDMSIDQAFLESSECFTEMLFMLSCFLGVVCRGKAWVEFFHNFTKADEQLHRLDFKDHGNICVFSVRLTVIHLAFFLVHAYEIIVWEDVHESSIEYGYILYRISMYYQFFTVYLTFCLAEMLRKRYMFLNKLVEDTLKEKSKIIIISVKDNRRVLDRLVKIQRIYTILFNSVQNINAIFGWTLFFYFSTFVMNILVNINYVLRFTQTEDIALNLRMLATYVIYSMVYTISTIAVVMSCDGVDQSGKTIVKTCFLHHEVLEKPLFKDEVILFARIIKELAPTFSAAGFFPINQEVLSTLFSAVTTYLIIIIQFNITL